MDDAHRQEDALVVFLGRQQLQRLLFRNLDVHAHTVSIATSLLQQFLRGTRDRLQVYVAIKTMYRAEVMDNGRQPFHRIVGVAHHTAAQKESFDIVAAVEFHRDFFQFRDRERGPLDVVCTTVDAVGTVILTVIRQHHLQERNASSVVSKRMADTYTTDSVAHHTFFAGAHGTTRRARDIVLRRLCEYPQFLHRLFCQHGCKNTTMVYHKAVHH